MPNDRLKQEVKIVQLEELVFPARIERRGNRDIPLLSMSGKNGLTLQSENARSFETNNPEMQKVVRKGQLVTGIHMDEGSVYILKTIEKGCVSPAYSIWDIDASKITPEYLEVALHSDYSLEYFRTTYVGTTNRRGKVPAELFLKLKIPLPPIEKQRKIVSILSKIVELKSDIERIKRILSQMDRNVYHSIVDESVCEKLIDISKISIGQAPKAECIVADKKNDPQAIPFYQGKTDFGDIYPRTETGCVEPPRVACEGDVIMSVREPIGEVNIALTECGYGRGLAAISPIEGRSNTAYLYTSLAYIKDKMPRGSGIMPSLSMKHLSSILLPTMNIREQEEFSAVFDKIITLRNKTAEIDSGVETVSAALCAQYFNRLQMED
ncbi:MAG: type restriction enzyme subunit [Candidatus Methanomethylophilaceae archaeon]|nr:type restriction enzyme subunit [Candidatus Methanomethylophilaceae archaeon]